MKNKFFHFLQNTPLILLSLVILSLSLLSYNFGFASVFFAIFTVIRIGISKEKSLIFLAIVCALFIGFLISRESFYYHRTQRMVGSANGEVFVQLDTLKISNYQVSFVGKFNKQIKVMCFLPLKSKKEQQKWQQIDQPITLAIKGELQIPEGQRNLNGFDYQKYLRGKKVALVCSVDCYTFKKDHSSSVFDQLSYLRFCAVSRIKKIFPKPLCYYLEGLLFSYSDQEFSDVLARFQRLGIIHFFCLSGFHVLFFLRVFRYLLLRCGVSLETTLILQLLASFFYAGMAAFSLSLLRGLFQKNAEYFSKRFNLGLNKQDCFFLSLLLGMCINPYLLVTIGGQLSYGFGFALLFWQVLTAKISSKVIQSIAFSTGVSITVLPLLWWHFFAWSPLSLILTCLLGWIFEHFLYAFFVFIFCFPFSLLVDLLNSLIQFLNKFLEIVENLFSFNWCVGKPSLFLLIFMWILIFLGIHFLEIKRKGPFFGFCLSLLLFSFLLTHPFYGLVMMVDVGQGDSLLIQEPFNKKVTLIDTGGRVSFNKNSNQMTNAEKTLIPVLKSLGIRVLDSLFLTHADADHCGDVDVLAKKIKIRTIYFPKGAEKRKALREKLLVIAQKGTKIKPVLALQKIDSFYLLSPTKIASGENNDSLVLYRNIGGKRFLFTGDLEREGEEELVKNYPHLRADILKVGHHGSDTSTSKELLACLRPSIAWISVGKKNRFSHPSKQTLKYLKQQKVYRTDNDGACYYQWSIFKGLFNQCKTVK
ncbi:MAG: DNA internalization-related competence protein ComEC/Rec2 [Streptococcaceae bacterium]|nr:DNA internalization-related competence protein ComEC/Rec2 [Streptococcaceae bacterium]